MELYEASKQWANRPADERFDSLEELHAATQKSYQNEIEKEVPWTDLTVQAEGDEVAVVGPAGVPAIATHYAFGQLAARAGAPASYLRTLPAELAASNLQHGLRDKNGGAASLLFHRNGRLMLRAATSDKYSRIWNYEVVSRLMDVAQRNSLVPARQTFTWGGEALPENRDASLYASDHDLFAFLMSSERVLQDPQGANLFRGIITKNSEVGDAKLTIMGFYFRDLCANHIIWGAQEIDEISLVHRGNIRERWNEATVKVRQYLDGAASLDEARIRETMVKIAGTKDEVLDLLFGKRSLGLTRKALAASYDAVLPAQDGDANTVWGMAQGITRHSQTLAYADERNQLDRAAGKLLSLTF